MSHHNLAKVLDTLETEFEEADEPDFEDEESEEVVGSSIQLQNNKFLLLVPNQYYKNLHNSSDLEIYN